MVFRATVTEHVTGVTLEGRGQSKVERSPYHIKLEDHSPQYFKPGLSYHGKCLVTTPDGVPAADVLVEISYLRYGREGSWEVAHNYTTDEAGFIYFGLPPVQSNKTLSIHAKLPLHDHEVDYSSDFYQVSSSILISKSSLFLNGRCLA